MGVHGMQKAVSSPLGVDSVVMTRSCCRSQHPQLERNPHPPLSLLGAPALPQRTPNSRSPLPRVLQLISGNSCCPFLPEPHLHIFLEATRAGGEAGHLQGPVPLWKH